MPAGQNQCSNANAANSRQKALQKLAEVAVDEVLLNRLEAQLPLNRYAFQLRRQLKTMKSEQSEQGHWSAVVAIKVRVKKLTWPSSIVMRKVVEFFRVEQKQQVSQLVIKT